MKKFFVMTMLAGTIASAFAAPTDFPLGVDKKTAALVHSDTAAAPNALITPGSATDTSAGQRVAESAKEALPPFGATLFNGKFSNEQFSGFNSDYQIAIGDRIVVKVWGALNVEQAVTVDPQGNIFIPNVGPIQVKGVKNGDLNTLLSAKTGQVFKSNVGVYASLDAAQPVKVFVTGAVRAPGLYAGVSADSILRYLDKAGGIDPNRGSYVEVAVQRQGQIRQKFNLYDFLTKGTMPNIQLADGDVVFVAPKKPAVTVKGAVRNANAFELADSGQSTLGTVLQYAIPQAGATHVLVMHKTGSAVQSEVVDLANAAQYPLTDGDQVEVTADKHMASIAVRIEGAHAGAQTLALPAGAKLGEVLSQLKLTGQSDVDGVQIFRKSVAVRQKEAIEMQLAHLQQTVLTARSATAEEAGLRKVEAELALKFIERARAVQPKGQVVFPEGSDKNNVLLEEDDVIRIPQKTSVVMVNGEVMFPSALAWTSGKEADYYIGQAGGYSQGSGKSQVLIVHANGTAQTLADAGSVKAGDELYVLPKVEGKNLEVTRGIAEILFRVAFAAKVALGL